MQLTILQFPNAKSMWEFKMRIANPNVELNFKNNTIICRCEEHELNLAIHEFKAQIKEAANT